jgi:hypothetical protein
MTVLFPGTPAPSFTLARGDGESFTEADLLGGTTVLVFYLTGPDGVVRWSYEAPSPGDLPGPDLLREGLESALGETAST